VKVPSVPCLIISSFGEHHQCGPLTAGADGPIERHALAGPFGQCLPMGGDCLRAYGLTERLDRRLRQLAEERDMQALPRLQHSFSRLATVTSSAL
jgi:hypothetical protein